MRQRLDVAYSELEELSKTEEDPDDDEDVYDTEDQATAKNN
jgi:hypothetical protein